MLNKTIKSFLVFSVSIFSLVFQNCLYTSFMHHFFAPDRNLYRNQGIYLQYNTLGNIHMNIQNIFGASIPSLTFFKQFLLYIFSLYRFRKITKLFDWIGSQLIRGNVCISVRDFKFPPLIIRPQLVKQSRLSIQKVQKYKSTKEQK